MKNKIRIVKGMVEDENVQKEVLRTGKVDTIISEPIGVMLFHERMVRLSQTVPDLVRIDETGGIVPPGEGLVLEARRSSFA
jgi:histone-arginine methyltransferase CARM1